DLTIPLGATKASQLVTAVSINGTALTEAHALEVVPGTDSEVYMINGTGATANLVRATISTGIGQIFGPLQNTRFDNDGGTPGQNISDITWNPVLKNPFLLTDSNPKNDKRKGMLVGVDTTIDELLVIDARNRFPFTNLFNVSLSGGDSSAR